MSAQFGEDAILARLFARIGTTNRVAVECGARDGASKSNTHDLRVNHGWTCILFDAVSKSPLVHEVFLTTANINQAFAAHDVPAAFDLLSIDVDGQDFYLWQALPHYHPRVVVIEYNSRFGPEESVVMAHRPDHRWDKTDYYGASAAALQKLGRQRGYSLVEYTRANLIFAKDETLLPPKAPYGYPRGTGRWEAY